MSPRLSLLALSLALVAGLVAAWPVLAVPTAHAQGGPDADAPALPTLVPRRAAITSSSDDLVRLALPREVIEASRSDLSDVRVVDAAEREIPYLVDRGDRPMPSSLSDPPTWVPVLPLEATRERSRSAGVDRFVERYVVEAPATTPPGARWVLRVESLHPRFACTVRALAAGPDRELIEIARGSFFRLGTPLRERLELPLPELSADRITLVIEGQDGYLEPRFDFAARREERAPARMEVPLAIDETRREPGRTILVVAPPAGVHPERITLGTTTQSFVRPVEVTAIDRDRGRRFLGRATILRVENVPGAEALAIDLAAGGGDRIEIAIADGDSPPLDAVAVTATVRPTTLIFEGRDAAMLRFGGGRLRPPRYDLQALFGTGIGEELLDRRIGGEARLGPLEDEPAFDPAPALTFAMRPGAAVDRARFRSRADVTIPDAREGLARFVASADLLAASAGDLRDLRIVGEDGRQWPFLISGEVPVVELPLEVGAASPIEIDGERWSEHALTLPVPRVAASSIVLEVRSPFVDRLVSVVAREEDGNETELGRGTISRRPGEEASLEVTTYGTPATELVVRVRDGDEEPLAIAGAIAELPSHEVFLVAPAGTYRALVGDEEASAPDYEISRARELVVAVEPATATVGPIAPNPAFREPGLLDRAGAETIAVWVVLILAVLVLGLLTLRVARAAPEPGPTPDAPPTASEPSPRSDPSVASDPARASDPAQASDPAPASDQAPASDPRP